MECSKHFQVILEHYKKIDARWKYINAQLEKISALDDEVNTRGKRTHDQEARVNARWGRIPTHDTDAATQGGKVHTVDVEKEHIACSGTTLVSDQSSSAASITSINVDEAAQYLEDGNHPGSNRTLAVSLAPSYTNAPEEQFKYNSLDQPHVLDAGTSIASRAYIEPSAQTHYQLLTQPPALNSSQCDPTDDMAIAPFTRSGPFILDSWDMLTSEEVKGTVVRVLKLYELHDSDAVNVYFQKLCQDNAERGQPVLDRVLKFLEPDSQSHCYMLAFR